MDFVSDKPWKSEQCIVFISINLKLNWVFSISLQITFDQLHECSAAKAMKETDPVL